MAQFDVYRNSGTYSEMVPFVVDIQNDILSNLDSRVVIPLQSADYLKEMDISTIQKLNPGFSVCDTEVVLAPQQMAAVHVRELGKKVDSLVSSKHEIISALDVLTAGI